MDPATPPRWTDRLPELPRVLHNRAYRRYWLSQLVSLTGTWMQQVASSLVVLTLTTSAFALGLVSVVGSLPMLLLTLQGGVVADRHDKRAILIVTQSLLGFFALVYAGLVLADVVAYWQLLALAVVFGVAAAFELPASQAFVPELIDREDLPEAIALNAVAFNGTRLLGPALAAVAIGAFGLASAFLLNALSFLAVIGVLVSLRGRAVEKPAVPRGGALREGLVYVRGRPALLGLVGITGLTSLLVFPNLAVLMPLYVTEVLGGGDAWVGVMLACSGAGSLTGSLALLRGEKTEAAANTRIRLGVVGVAAGLLGLALAPSFAVAIPATLVLSFSLSRTMAQVQTRVQELAPDALRGRVMSIHGLAFTGVMPFAILLVSGTAELIGLPRTLLIAAALYLVIGVVLYRRFIRHPAVDPDGVAAVRAVVSP